MSKEEPWVKAYLARFEGSEYGSDALGLFALGLRFGAEDLDTLASEVITGGGDDKKCDIVFIDRDEQRAVVCQCYLSEKTRASAPANKASDLNTAINWLLCASISSLPKELRPYAEELRDAIKSDEIRELFIWYTHNLPESSNCEKELKTVETSAATHVRELNGKENIRISASEVGSGTFKQWYEESQSPILVTDKFTVKCKEAMNVNGNAWRAIVTLLPGSFFYQLYQTYGTKLFSANVRDYLGSRASDSNINFAIKGTAERNSDNFWVFNNGITAIVNKGRIRKTRSGKELVLEGISIVNGAQTTGAIGSLDKAPAETLFVPARFIETESSDLVDDIIRFNNSQNKISASDFRSSDSIQRRLKSEFSVMRDVEYDGGRRGGASDAIRRRPSLLPSLTVGQALAAFHSDPVVAYNRKAQIWINDTLYSRYFHEKTTAAHIVFAYSLFKQVNLIKTTLKSKLKNAPSTLTDIERAQVDFFEQKGANFLLCCAIAECLETILGRRIPDRFSLQFKKKNTLRDAETHWSKILPIALPLSSHLNGGFAGNRITSERQQSAVASFKALFAAVAEPNRKTLSEFAQGVLSA